MYKAIKWVNNHPKSEEKEPEKEISNTPIIEYRESGIVECVNNHIYFYSEIEREKVLAFIKTFKDKETEFLLEKHKYDRKNVDPLILHLQSYGGLAHTGLSIYDTLKNSRIPIHTIVDGVVASAATFLLLGGSKRFMQKNSQILIHQLSTGFWGTYEQFEDEKKNLDSLMKLVEDIYLKETKIPKTELRKLMKNDIYFNSEEALKYGIIDAII